VASEAEEIQDVRAVKADDEVELHYEVLGEGPPVVLLHGGLVGRSAFKRMREALAERYTMILPSSRGHDGTELTLPPDYGFETSEVRDLTAVMDAEGLERVHLIGHSSGGSTAFAFARDCPERVDRLILVEPSLMNILPEADLRPVKAGALRIIETGERNGDMAALRLSIDETGGDAWNALDEATKAKHLERLAPLAPFVVPHWRILLSFDVSLADLEALKPPTMLFYGTRSFDFEPAIGAVWRRIRPDLPLITVEGAGHNVHHDCPDIVNSKILNFLGADC
jgi:pimeloyl-ACP methyl ester carboxylesterase